MTLDEGSRVQGNGHAGRRRWTTPSALLVGSLVCIALATLEHYHSKRIEAEAQNGEKDESIGIGFGVENPLSSNTAEEQGASKVDDSRDLFSFGGEARDGYVASSRFGRFQEPGDVPGDEPETHPDDSIFNLWGLLAPDAVKPFWEHSRYLKPGDVAEDAPPQHHKDGAFNLFGFVRDNSYDVATDETERSACCKCIPGAPSMHPTQAMSIDPFDWFREMSASVLSHIPRDQGQDDNDQGEQVHVGEAGVAPAGKEVMQTNGMAVPVVEAVPIEQATPVEQTTTETQPAPATRRLLSLRTAVSSSLRTAGPKTMTLANIKRLIASTDGKSFIMVAVPQSARAGDLMKVHGPDGGQFAFAVPANVPADGIIKVDLPSLAEDGNVTEISGAGNATASEGPGSANATEPAQSGTSEGEGDDEDEDEDQEPSVPEVLTPEGVHIGFGAGMSPPRAATEEQCCFCPLYDSSSGRIIGWTHDPAAHPSVDSSSFDAFRKAVEWRHSRIEEALGIQIYPATFLGAEAPEFEDASNYTNSSGEAVNANESMDTSSSNGSAAEFASVVQHLAIKASAHSQAPVTAVRVGQAGLGSGPAVEALRKPAQASAVHPAVKEAPEERDVQEAIAAVAAHPVVAHTNGMVQALAKPVQQASQQQAATPVQAYAKPVQLPAVASSHGIVQAYAKPVSASASTNGISGIVQAYAKPEDQPASQPVQAPTRA